MRGAINGAALDGLFDPVERTKKEDLNHTMAQALAGCVRLDCEGVIYEMATSSPDGMIQI